MLTAECLGKKKDSEYYFAGIKVKGGIEVNGFVLDEGQTKIIQVQSTMPIGCSYTEGQDIQRQSCFVVLHNGIPGYQLADNCVQSVKEGNVEFKPEACRLNISHDDWNSTHNISITANADNIVNIADRIVYLRLFATKEISTYVSILEIWNTLVLPDIKIYIKDTDEAKLASSCYSHNDPHMRTFDGRKWELQGKVNKEGEYTLYRHKMEPQQVNVYLSKCSSLSTVLCNCGVAIRSAESSFVVNFCNTTDQYGKKRINRYAISRMCDAQNLLVQELKDDHYKVTFPTGTTVEFNYRQIGTFVVIQAIDISPSQFDFKLTSGLCGLYSGNKDDGLQMKTGSNATLFANSWRVEPSDSLFKGSGQLPELHYKVREYCTCKVPQSQGIGVQLPAIFQCRLSDQLRACRDLDAPSSVARATCISSAHRTRRSSDRSRTKRSKATDDGLDGIPPQYDMRTNTDYDSSLLNDPEWRNGLTEEKARETCRRNMVDLPAYSVCSTFVPIVSSEDVIEECVKDMKAVGSDSFMMASLENYENRCFQTAKQMENLTKTNTTNPYGESKPILDVISELTCPQNCSGKGTCKEGKCNCNSGSYGRDCSLDKTKPPRILKEGFNEHCDSTAKACRKIPIPGSDFIAENLTCEFVRFVVSANNSQINDSASAIHPGNYSSTFMMYCEVPETRMKRATDTTAQMATGYYISVSNDGSTFTDKLTFIIYNPSCFQCNSSTISCAKLDTCPEQYTVPDDSNLSSTDQLIPIICGVGGFVLFLGLIVIVIKRCVRRLQLVEHTYEPTEMINRPVTPNDLYLSIANPVPVYDKID